MMDIYSREIIFLYQGGVPVNSFLEKFMEDLLPVTLEKARHTSWPKTTTFGPTCSKILQNLSRGVPFVK